MRQPRIAAVLLLLVVIGPSWAAPEAPSFKRERSAQARQTPPAPPRAPEGLTTKRKTESRRASLAQAAAAAARTEVATEDAPRDEGRTGGRRAVVRPAPPAPPPGPTPEEIDGAGYEAGTWSADALARTAGRREAYRVGLWEGQRAAFEDPGVGQADFVEGLRAGQRDPGALAYGSSEGERAADETAPGDAEAQVERQFGDLSWRPVRSPRPAGAAFRGSFPATTPPSLEAVFRENPPVSARMSDGFRGWTWDPWRLHESRAWTDFHDGSWQDAGSAFALWAADARRSAFWRRLDSNAARDLFRAAFEDGFWDRLDRARDRWLDAAFAEGFEDGFGHGAFVKGEWSYRRGYAEGFDRGMAFAAEVAFERAYPRAFLAAYHDAFDAWTSTSHPVIVAARLHDATDDGVFQPGEPVEVAFTLANLGGATGRHVVRLGGGPLEAPAAETVELPARRLTESVRALEATLDPRTAVPSSETLVLSVEGERMNLPLRVAHPVEFTGTIDYASRPLERSARIAFEVENRSRKPVTGVAIVLENGDRREIGPLAPGASTVAAFELNEVRPLDLLSGGLELRAEAVVADVVWDRRQGRFPERATDLQDPALLDYLIALGHERDPDPRDVVDARRLLAQRLAADWDAAKTGDSNPFKSDFRNGETRTALGALVAAYERESGELSRSMAFHGLGDEIVAQARDLPGANPLLRRWFVRLAEGLP